MSTSNPTLAQILELSKTDSLDIWTVMKAIHTAQGGVLDFLCNELYKFPDAEIETFIPQLCNRVLKDINTTSLARFLMDKCSSMHLAIKMFSWFQAAVEDGVFSRSRATELWNECEMAAINSKSRSALRLNQGTSTFKKNNSADDLSNIDASEKVIPKVGSGAQTLRSPRSNRFQHKDDINFRSSRTNLKDFGANPTAAPVPSVVVITPGVDLEDPSTLPSPGPVIEAVMERTGQISLSDSAPDVGERPHVPLLRTLVPSRSASYGNHNAAEEESEAKFISKRLRHDAFHAEIQFVSQLTLISTMLKKQSAGRAKPELNRMLWKALGQLQNDFVGSNITEEELESGHLGVHIPIQGCNQPHRRIVRLLPKECFCLSSRDRVPFMLFVETIEMDLVNPVGMTKSRQTPVTKHHKEKSIVTALDKVILETGHKMPQTVDSEGWVMVPGKDPNSTECASTRTLAYPELWTEKTERLRKLSPYGHHPKWKIQSVIVKSGDDLRQDQLASQLITVIHDIFKEADVPLWLYPYSVTAMSSNTGFIETIPDAISVDSLKKRIPNMKSLEDFFLSVYGEKTSMRFMEAQRNFVESLAAYSLVTYLLQIKDRHNGNILLDKDGHVIHIDYGFMLTSSPGSLNFETAPFKLTKEHIDLMGGEHRDMFHYFKLLFIRGFLELRNHCDRFVLLIEGLLPGHKMGCFARREATVRELIERLHLELDENHAIEYVVNHIIKESMSNWRTESYDNYQYYVNGILA